LRGFFVLVNPLGNPRIQFNIQIVFNRVLCGEN